MNSGIYEIVNKTNGHRYVGSSVDISDRWRCHKKDLNKNKHHSRYLQRAFNKYGADAFVFQVIEHCFSFMLIPREQHYIDALKPEYNIAPKAGSNLGIKHTPETCAKNSAAQMGKKNPPLTAEQRANMSAAQMGKKKPPLTAEHRAKLSVAGIIYWAKRKLAESEAK